MNAKTIITVQHTESEHHLNGHAGAWGNWSLTANGRSGSIFKFAIDQNGRVTANYINHRLWE